MCGRPARGWLSVDWRVVAGRTSELEKIIAYNARELLVHAREAIAKAEGA